MNKYLCTKSLFAFLFVLFGITAKAQLTEISGKIIDSATQQGLGSASIISNGKAVGIAANDGTFNVKSQVGSTLIFSYQGYKTVRQTATSGFMTVVMAKNDFDKQNTDIVVVAMDMKRNTRELGYSAPVVSGDEIQQTQRQNFITGLEGRVAGLTINPTSGMAGASAQIILRGYNSVAFNNQPLFVIDGVIMDNTTFNETSNGGTGIGLKSDGSNVTTDYNNRIADLNPNDIASVTVLKGPEATALYGSQGGSGAIVITTKKANTSGKILLNYNDNLQIAKETRFVQLDNDFSPGGNGLSAQTLGTTSIGNDYSYFGPAYPSGTKMYDNLRDFFKTGFAQTHNLSADFGVKNVGFRISGTIFNQNGVIPDNTYKKDNITISNNTKIGKYITLTPSFSYIYSKNNAPLRGISGLMSTLYSWPTTDNMKNYLTPSGDKRTLYFSNPNADYDNPYWFAQNVHSGDEVHRYVSTLGVDIHPFDWLTLSGRFGYDTYKDNGFKFIGPESYELSSALGGSLDNYYKTYKGYSHTINLTANKKIGKFSGRIMVGTMWQDLKTQIYSNYGTNLLDSSYNATDSSNTLASTRQRLSRTVLYGLPNLSEQEQVAYYGEVVLGYNNVLFLDFTQRFESSSVFPKAYRNYNYPGVSLSAILSDLIPDIKSQNGLTYAKLRASISKAAHLPPPYLNQSVFVINNAASQVPPAVYSYGFQGNNPYLQPEFQHAYDLGGEFRFLKDRISFEADYYNYHNVNQIGLNVRESYATGFALLTFNAFETRNQGVEATLGVIPVQTKNWVWNMQFNFSKTWSHVIQLSQSIGSGADYYDANTQEVAGVRSAVMQGYPVTEMTGLDYQRNNAGQILIDPNSGLPLVNSAYTPVGDRNPNFKLGINNNLSYKNWNLSMLWDLRVGGAIFNGTEDYLTGIGKSRRTADRLTPRVIQGVLADGLQNSTTPTPNNIVITPYYNNTYYATISGIGGMPATAFIQKNVNAFELRDITLGYTFDNKLFSNLKPVRSLTAFVTCNNVFLLTNYRGADPYVNMTTAGDNGVGGFGMDYLTPANPAFYSFGIRLNF